MLAALPCPQGADQLAFTKGLSKEGVAKCLQAAQLEGHLDDVWPALEELQAECPEDLRNDVFFEVEQEEHVVPWLRQRKLNDCSVVMIAEALVRHTTTAARLQRVPSRALAFRVIVVLAPVTPADPYQPRLQPLDDAPPERVAPLEHHRCGLHRRQREVPSLPRGQNDAVLPLAHDSRVPART